MMGAQDQARGGETRRGPGLWAAVLAFGLLVVLAAGSLKALRDRSGPADAASAGPGTRVTGLLEHDTDDCIDAVAIMSDRTFDGGAGEFTKVDAVAIMGHFVLDLRNARVRGEKAVIDVVAIMGHVELIVPPDWEITTGDMLSAGKVRNLARRSAAENPKKVRIDGVVLMGRLDVRR